MSKHCDFNRDLIFLISDTIIFSSQRATNTSQRARTQHLVVIIRQIITKKLFWSENARIW